MCLAVIGRIVEIKNQQAISDIDGNLINVNIQLTPDVFEGQYILIHAGFSIACIEKKEVAETQTLINQVWEVLDYGR